MPNKIESDLLIKANPGQINIDEAQGIVECFVAGIGNKDSVGDVIQPGAFTESLKRRRPRVVWGHNWNDPIGKVLEIYEVGPNDARLPEKMKRAGIGGLYAKVQFNLNTDKGREAFASVAFFGNDQEWSIGYKTINATFDPGRQANILREVELYECSPVLHGANQLTGTISVKADPVGVFESIDDMIDALMDDQSDEFDEKGARLRDPKGGLTAAGRRHFARTEGANLKPGVKGPADTPEKMRRKGSFLTRFFTNPSGPMKKPNGKPTRLALSAAAWGEPVPQDRSDAARLAAKGRRMLERYQNSKKKDAWVEFDDELFWEKFDESDFNVDEKCGMMGQGMPSEVRQRWMEMIANSRPDDEDDDEYDDDSDDDIFEEGLARDISPEARNQLEMEMNSRSKYPVKIMEASENMVVFALMKNGQKMMFRMSYHHDKREQKYMFGKPERVHMTFAPMPQGPSVEAKPQIDPTRQYGRSNGDESVMPRILRIVEKLGADEKALISTETADFIESMEIELKAGRVISKRNLNKLKDVISLLQDIISSAGEMEMKSDEMLIKCDIRDAFATKSLLDPIIEYHGAVAEVTENGIVIKSGATEQFREAVGTAMSAFSTKALGTRIGGGGGKGPRAARLATARFDPNAIDGDEDGLVQEGTTFERPATPKAPSLPSGQVRGAAQGMASSVKPSSSRQKPKSPAKTSPKRKFRTDTASAVAEFIDWAKENDVPALIRDIVKAARDGKRRYTAMDAIKKKNPKLGAQMSSIFDGLILSGARERDGFGSSAQTRKRLADGEFLPLDAHFWKVGDDGSFTVRRNSDGQFIPSWREDEKYNGMLATKFNSDGKPVAEIAREEGLTRREVRRAIQEDMGKKRGMKPTTGFASDTQARPKREMVERDSRGNIIGDGMGVLNDLAEKREKRLRELGFDDDQIEALLGYRPQSAPPTTGFASGMDPYRRTVEANISELNGLIKKRDDFLKKHKDFDPDANDWNSDEWINLIDEYLGIVDEIDAIVNFYDEEGGRLAGATTAANDLRDEIDEIRSDIETRAKTFVAEMGLSESWQEVVMAAEEGDWMAFMSQFASGRREGDQDLGDGVDLLGDESEYIRDVTESAFESITESIHALDEKQSELYGAEMDLSEATYHGSHAEHIKQIMNKSGKVPRKSDAPLADRGFSSRRQPLAGAGLGRSRNIKIKPNSPLESVYYDAENEILLVKFNNNDKKYMYMGIDSALADDFEKMKNQGQAISRIKLNARGYIAVTPDGQPEAIGKIPMLHERLEADMKRLGSFGSLTDDERRIYQEVLDFQKFTGVGRNLSDDQRLDLARRVADMSANMLRKKEFAASKRLSEAALDVVPYKRRDNKFVPVVDQLELTLSSGEIRDYSRALKAGKELLGWRLGSNVDKQKEVSDSIDRFAKLISGSDGGPIKMSADEYNEFYDALHEGLDFLGLDGMRYAMDQMALSMSGKYSTGSLERAAASKAGARSAVGLAPNNGAPSDITPRMQDEFIYWAQRQGGFRRVKELADRYEKNGKRLTSKDWVRLHDYYALYSPAGKGMALYGQSRRSTGFSSSAPNASATDAPRKRAPGAGRKVGAQLEKRFRGKKWDEVKPEGWDLMSADQQEEELITNLKPERSGLAQAEFDRLIRELAERSLDDEESRADRIRRVRQERMQEREARMANMSESERDAMLEESRMRQAARERATAVRQSDAAEDGKKVTAADARAVRKKIRERLDASIYKESDRMRAEADSGGADPMHADAWENMVEIMGSSSDLTLSQLDALTDALEEYLDDANSLDEMNAGESRSVRNAKALLSRVEDIKEQYEDDPFITRGETDTGERLRARGDDFVDAVERAGFSSILNPYKRNIVNYLNVRDDSAVRDRGFASSQDRAGRTEIKGQATFFKDVKESLPKEIREAEKAGDSGTAKALRLLDKIMERQETAKTGSKRTDAGQMLVTQKELDEILDALMVVVDRQMSIGGEERLTSFVKLMDMLAASGMATFINKTTEEIGSRTQERVNSRGSTVQIPNN